MGKYVLKAFSATLILLLLLMVTSREILAAGPADLVHEAGLALVITTAVFIGIFALATAENDKHKSQQETGWINAEHTSKESFYLHRGIPPRFSFRVRINELSFVYKNASKSHPFGDVCAGESYGVEEERNNEEGKWYQIIFLRDHLLENEK